MRRPVSLGDGARDKVGAGGERVPVPLREPVLGRDAPGVALARGHRRVVVGKDDERVGSAGVAHQRGGSDRGFHAGRVRVRIGEGDRHERAHHRQPAGRELVA